MFVTVNLDFQTLDIHKSILGLILIHQIVCLVPIHLLKIQVMTCKNIVPAQQNLPRIFLKLYQTIMLQFATLLQVSLTVPNSRRQRHS